MKKYPAGTRIRYKGCAFQDRGKEGIIVEHTDGYQVWIVVPGSYIALQVYGNPEHRWSTDIGSLEILAVKNQQLLFDFMN